MNNLKFSSKEHARPKFLQLYIVPNIKKNKILHKIFKKAATEGSSAIFILLA